MRLVPAVNAVAAPVDEFIFNVPVWFTLDHVPVPVTSDRVTVVNGHADNDPVMAAGAEFTVIARVAKQPVDNVYEIIAFPATTPVIVTGDEASIVAMPELLVDQVPLAVASENVVLVPGQVVCVPDMDAGFAFTVNMAVALQLLKV